MSQNNLVLSHDALHERCSSRSGIIAIGTRRRRRRQAVDGSQIHFRGGDGVIGSVNSQHSRAATVAAVTVQAEVVIRVAVEARSKPPATGTTTSLLWARTTKNTDCSTWPLARPFARSLAPLKCSLARSLCSLPRSWDSDWWDGYLFCVFLVACMRLYL